MSYEAHTVNGVKLYEPKPGNPIVKIFDADKVEPEFIQIFINQLTDKVDGFGTEVFVTEGDKEVWIYDNGNIDAKEIVDEFETLRAELEDEEIEGLDKPYIVIQSDVVEENNNDTKEYVLRAESRSSGDETVASCIWEMWQILKYNFNSKQLPAALEIIKSELNVENLKNNY